MNTQYDELETRVGAELRDRAGHVDGTLLSLTDVHGRARQIRRRRRVGAGIAVAAVLAIAVPLGLNGAGTTDTMHRIDPAVPARQDVVRTKLTLDGLDRGAEPAVEYFTQDGVVLPGVGLQPLEDSWQALVPSRRDGWWLGLSPTRDNVVVLSQNFEQLSETPVNQALVSNGDRGLAAWTALGAAGQTLTLHSTVEDVPDAEWEFPAEPPVAPVDFVSDSSVLFKITSRKDGSVEMGIANQDASTSMFEGDWMDAVSANPETGLVVVQTKGNRDATGCFGVVDPSASTSQTVWDTCDYSLGAFSPDGRYLLASDPYQDGLGQRSLSILDAATGDLVASFRQPRGGRIILPMVVWETTDSVAATALKGASWMILRFRVDGTLEQASDTVQSDPYADFPITFGADRLR